jgi:DNA-binding MarR family transcriptional regulator
MIEHEKSSIDSIIENLISIHPLLTKSFTRSIRTKTKTNLSVGSLYVLALLSRNGVSTMSDIGIKLSMPKPHVTTLVDRLIAEEMVERLYDPKDRRIVNIKITNKGVEDFNTIKLDISQEMRQSLQLLDHESLTLLSSASKQVKEILISMVSEQNGQ